MMQINILQKTAHAVRRRVLQHTLKNNGGYLSQACSSAEILTALYLEIMKLAPVDSPVVPPQFSGVPGSSNPGYITGAQFNGIKAPHLDRFFLSPSQYSLVLYALLVETGRMSEQGMEQFNQDKSTVEMIGAEHSPGMEIMTGSLGQGLAQAAGIAWARKKKGESGKVWIFMSDGEFQIGMTWETMQTISFYKLDNIGIYVDMNGQQCDGRIDTVMNIEPLDRKLVAFGADVHRVNGHDFNELTAPVGKWKKDSPLIVLASTNPWQGIEILKNKAPKFHYIRFGDDEERKQYEKYLL
jgi:transketolase